MITSNIDIPKGLVNGTRGVVVKMKADEWVSVKLVNGEVFRVKTRVFDTRHSKIGRRQVPLILAWAITVHKSQGQTIDYAQIDLSSRIFADGQAYVALSRVRSLEGLFITKFVKSSIRANASVLEFAKAIGDIP
jgi:ATP-dependent DNA helicase PIF1